MRRSAVSPVRFRLLADPEKLGGLYVLVQVWPTKRAFQAGNRGDGLRAGSRCDGTCYGVLIRRYPKRRPRRVLPLFAVVNLWRGKLTMEVVTHELFHATIAWGRRVGFDWQRFGAEDSINRDEDRITYVHGRLCRQFMVRAIELGLYGEQDMVTVQ